MQNNDTIISDFLDINKDISAIGLDKKFKLYYNLKKIKYRKRLIADINKLKESNMILSRDNLLEIALYVYNNYLPDGKYDCITSTQYYPKSEAYVLSILNDDKSYKYTILINNDKKFTITISSMHINEDNKGYTINLDRLESPNREISGHLKYVNSILLNTICKYILQIVESYNGKENEL